LHWMNSYNAILCLDDKSLPEEREEIEDVIWSTVITGLEPDPANFMLRLQFSQGLIAIIATAVISVITVIKEKVEAIRSPPDIDIETIIGSFGIIIVTV